MRRLILAGVAVLLLSGAAAAETAPRCAILGQMAVSSWLELMAGLTKTDASALDPLISRLAGLSAAYGDLGCDIPTLGAAMDCLFERSGTGLPRDLARACMDESGLTKGQ